MRRLVTGVWLDESTFVGEQDDFYAIASFSFEKTRVTWVLTVGRAG